MAKRDEVPSTDRAEIETLRERVRSGRLSEGDLALVDRLLGLLLTLISVIEQKNLSIKRLKRLIFGPGSDTRAASTSEIAESSATAEEASESAPLPDAPKRPGHGRLSAADYSGAAQVRCDDATLSAGARCPNAPCSGRLYDTHRPSVFIRLTGQPLVGATRFEQQVLRCSACQARFTARLPDSVPPEKYDPTADVAIAMAKYAAGLPFYRLARVQASFGVPLPESVQWERVEALANVVHPVFLHLERLAAQGEVLFADDTGVKILACIRENKQKAEGERTGTYTTGIISRVDRHQIALYRSGRRHAGENVGRVLDARPAGLPAPVQIGDALSRNWSHAFTVVVAKCLAHARRQFVDLQDAFPAECKRVLDDLASVYRFDAQTEGKTPAERLDHHTLHSKPVLDALHVWIEEQFRERLVEPNSGLGSALSYLVKHWPGLTRFLEDGRAPLDTNTVERALRLAVLNRKNSLFYKTEHGAAVGDILTSLIQTCQLNGVGAWDYLLTLTRNGRAVRATPAAWLPWTYRRDGERRDAA